MDANFYKNRYQHTWARSVQREKAVRVAVEVETGARVVAGPGFKAESTEFINGTAKSNGFERSAPDYRVGGTNLFIEVTGTDHPAVNEGSAIWILDQKVHSAANHPERDNWVVYCLPSKGGEGFHMRAIHLGQAFFGRSGAHAISRVPHSSGTYYAVPANHPAVRPMGDLYSAVETKLMTVGSFPLLQQFQHKIANGWTDDWSARADFGGPEDPKRLTILRYFGEAGAEVFVEITDGKSGLKNYGVSLYRNQTDFSDGFPVKAKLENSGLDAEAVVGLFVEVEWPYCIYPARVRGKVA